MSHATNPIDEGAAKAEIMALRPQYTFPGPGKHLLGVGGFASVLLARDQVQGVPVAIKRIGRSVLDYAGRRIVNEIMLFSQIQHDNIVRMKDCFTNATTPGGKFDAVYMVFEWVHNDLKVIIRHVPPIMQQCHQSWIMYQLFLALHCLHSANVVHRDITPSNILVNPNGTEVKLIDLGLSRVAVRSEDMTSYVTQRYYRAPEVVMAVGHGFPVDMWSAGCVLAEIIRKVELFRLPASRTGETEDRTRYLRAQQLVRLLTVVGVPAAEDMQLITSASVISWLQEWTAKAARRHALVQATAEAIIKGDYPNVLLSVKAFASNPKNTACLRSSDVAMTSIRDMCIHVSTSRPDHPENAQRVADAVSLIVLAASTFNTDPRLFIVDPAEDMVKATRDVATSDDFTALLPYLEFLFRPYTGVEPSLRQELPVDIEPAAFDLIQKLLTFAPHRRLTSLQAIQHPYVAQWYDAADVQACEISVEDGYTKYPTSDDYDYAVTNEIATFQAANEARKVQDAGNLPAAAPPATDGGLTPVPLREIMYSIHGNEEFKAKIAAAFDSLKGCVPTVEGTSANGLATILKTLYTDAGVLDAVQYYAAKVSPSSAGKPAPAATDEMLAWILSVLPGLIESEEKTEDVADYAEEEPLRSPMMLDEDMV